MSAFFNSEAWNVAVAVITAIGGGGAIVLGLSTWLGKVWADRILEAEKAKYQREFAELKGQIDRSIHTHNVAATRIDAQRVDAIRELYGALVAWHETVVQIVAPNNFGTKPHAQAIARYLAWAEALRAKSEQLENVAMITAIYFSEETYRTITRCGISASTMSIDFLGAIRNDPNPNTPQHLASIENARTELQGKYDNDYGPAREAVVTTFRRFVDPITQ